MVRLSLPTSHPLYQWVQDQTKKPEPPPKPPRLGPVHGPKRPRGRQPTGRRLAKAYWSGYRRVYVKGHPLNSSSGRYGQMMPEHQVVLYDKIGPGPHVCHWQCGRTDLQWKQGLAGLTVDHLDWDINNNDPSNLVPACWPCNKNRKKCRKK